MEITGKFKEKNLLSFKKKDGTIGTKYQLVISYMSGTYENDLAIIVWREKDMEAVKNIPNSAEVTVKFDVKSRKWEGKWYTDVSAYSVVFDALPEQGYNPTQAKGFDTPFAHNEAETFTAEPEEDDLPF